MSWLSVPRHCLVCQHPDRGGLDRALVGGKSLRETSALFRVSEDSLARHRDSHLRQKAVRFSVRICAYSTPTPSPAIAPWGVSNL